MIRLIRKWLSARHGSVLVETALLLPLLLILLLGGIEVSRMVMVTYKLQKTAGTVADLVSRQETVSTTTVDGIFEAIPHVMAPFNLGINGLVTVSSVTGTSDGMIVNWQRAGGGELVTTSGVGSVGGPATLPDGMVLREGVTAIASEIAFVYTPLFMPELQLAGPIRFTAVYRPREGGLMTMEPS